MTTTTIEKSAPAAARIKQFAVANESIARHSGMRQEVLKAYPQAKFNDSGRRMNEEERWHLVNYVRTLAKDK